jgi:hypothetical protein
MEILHLVTSRRNIQFIQVVTIDQAIAVLRRELLTAP